MSILITPTVEYYFEGLHNVLDAVAREKRYLAFTQAPPRDEACSFFRNIVANDFCQYLAVQNNIVVGWCDVLPTHGEARAHVGTFGIGVAASVRHLGIGTKLMEATIQKAWAKGLSRIELSVRTDNQIATALYTRFGFVHEGVNRNAFSVDGKYFDTYSMALLCHSVS